MNTYYTELPSFAPPLRSHTTQARSSWSRKLMIAAIMFVVVALGWWLLVKLKILSFSSQTYDYDCNGNSTNCHIINGDTTALVEKFEDICIQPQDAAALLSYALNSLGWIDAFVKEYTKVINISLQPYVPANTIILKNPNGGQAFVINEASISIKNCLITANATTFMYIPLLSVPLNGQALTVKDVYFDVSSTTSVISLNSNQSAITNKVEKIEVVTSNAGNVQPYIPLINKLVASIVTKYFQAPIQLVTLQLPLNDVCSHICDLINQSGFVCC